MRYYRPRRSKFRGGDKSFRRNDTQDLRISGLNSHHSHQRKAFGRNGLNAEKLLEKYNSLAKEALSNGDKILSESYYQHADHFLRIIGNRSSVQNNPKQDLENTTIKKNSSDEIKLEEEKNSSPQQLQPSEEI